MYGCDRNYPGSLREKNIARALSAGPTHDRALHSWREDAPPRDDGASSWLGIVCLFFLISFHSEEELELRRERRGVVEGGRVDRLVECLQLGVHSDGHREAVSGLHAASW